MQLTKGVIFTQLSIFNTFKLNINEISKQKHFWPLETYDNDREEKFSFEVIKPCHLGYFIQGVKGLHPRLRVQVPKAPDELRGADCSNADVLELCGSFEELFLGLLRQPGTQETSSTVKAFATSKCVILPVCVCMRACVRVCVRACACVCV